jgi:hypothetical protein
MTPALPLRLIAAVLGQQAEAAHDDRVVREAEAMNELLRQHEAIRMAQAKEGFKGAAMMANMAEAAQAVGELLAKEGAWPLGGTGRLVNAARQAGVGPPSLLSRIGAAVSPNARLGQAIKAEGLTAAVPRPAAPVPTPTIPKPGKSPFSIGMGTKAKVLGSAALLGAGYAGYKGLQAAKDYMMMPSGSSMNWGQGGPQPMSGVNQYGYPQQ